MDISSIMKKPVYTVNASDSAHTAVTLMMRRHIGGVLVLQNKKLVGIITEHDFFRRLVAKNKQPSKTTCSSIMTKHVKTIDINEEVVDAIKLMVKYGVKRLPVLQDKRLVGIVTATDILKSGENIEYAAVQKLAQYFEMYQPVVQAG